MKNLLFVLFTFLAFSTANAANCVAVVYDDPSEQTGLSIENVTWEDAAALRSDLRYLIAKVQFSINGSPYTDKISAYDLIAFEEFGNGNNIKATMVNGTPEKAIRHIWRAVGNSTDRDYSIPLNTKLPNTSGVDVTLYHKDYSDPDYDAKMSAAQAANIGTCTP